MQPNWHRNPQTFGGWSRKCKSFGTFFSRLCALAQRRGHKHNGATDKCYVFRQPWTEGLPTTMEACVWWCTPASLSAYVVSLVCTRRSAGEHLLLLYLAILPTTGLACMACGDASTTVIPFVDTFPFFSFISSPHLDVSANVDLCSGENLIAQQWKAVDSWRATRGRDLHPRKSWQMRGKTWCAWRALAKGERVQNLLDSCYTQCDTAIKVGITRCFFAESIDNSKLCLSFFERLLSHKTQSHFWKRCFNVQISPQT